MYSYAYCIVIWIPDIHIKDLTYAIDKSNSYVH